MFRRGEIVELDDFFKKRKDRSGENVYVYRFTGWSQGIWEFFGKYYKKAETCGIILRGRIPNPTEQNLSYYGEIMGLEFRMDMRFFLQQLAQWLPRLNLEQRECIAGAIYDVLMDMHRQGKNLNILKNAYIKFMCWFYYKFERMLVYLGNEEIPKILCEGVPGTYELRIMDILSRAGCDIVLLQAQSGDSLSREQSLFRDYKEKGIRLFPPDFQIQKLGEQIEKKKNLDMLYGEKPLIEGVLNTWSQEEGLQAVLVPPGKRGAEGNKFYHYFQRITGVEDKATYLGELFGFYESMRQSGRRILILEQIPKPDPQEIAGIQRQNYKNIYQLISHLSGNIRYRGDPQLERLINRTFIDIMLEMFEKDENLHRLTNRAVYLLSWLGRYQKELFAGWTMPEVSCVIDFGGCRDENEAYFLKFLSKLPIDLLILVPNQEQSCCLEDRRLGETVYEQSMEVESFPKEDGELSMGTAAYYAERELDTLMYRDSGMYRVRQHEKAASVALQTMYEEIRILWNEELKYRPNFQVVKDVVTMPVICAKVSGVKNRDLESYWEGIRQLNTEDTMIIKKVPWIQNVDQNPMKPYVTEFFKNKRLQKQKIKQHRLYPYGFLREVMQDHILEKLEVLIQQQIIRGTFENGTEYTIISTILNLSKDLLRMIQKFDFTKKNPKLIFVHTTEQSFSLEDSILIAFLNLTGFDILLFAPTGYQGVEGYFNRKIMVEHEIGEYMYDVRIPEFSKEKGRTALSSLKEKIFKRGDGRWD